MTYYVEGIDKVFWEYAKRGMRFDSYSELLQNLNEIISEYLEQETIYTEREIVELAIGTFSNYMYSGLMKRYDINSLFQTIIGNPILNSVFGPDERPIREKVLVAILGFIRNQQVRTIDGEVLVDWGKYNGR